jgi:hypothetical protein
MRNSSMHFPHIPFIPALAGIERYNRGSANAPR